MKILGLYFSMRPMQENMGRGEWIAFNEKPIHKLLEGRELEGVNGGDRLEGANVNCEIGDRNHADGNHFLQGRRRNRISSR